MCTFTKPGVIYWMLSFYEFFFFGFIFGEASIKECAQRTTRRLSQNSFQLVFIQPNPFTAFASI